MERLKVLLYITAEADAVDIHHELTTQLAHYLGNHVEATLVASHGNQLSDLTPYHLIHIFGCWSRSAAHLLIRAHKQHIPTVFTPLGGLQPWVMKHHKSGHLSGLTRRMTALASAVHVCGKLEAETFVCLGWNKRMALIKNPVLTSQLSFDDMTQQMLTLYRKVLDSNARLLLSPESCMLIGQLLAVSIDADILHDKDRCKQLMDQLQQLSDDDWRRIWIYSADEQIESRLHGGLARLQFTPPETDTSSVVRFNPEEQYHQGPLKADDTYSRNILLHNKISDAIEAKEQVEKRFVVQLLNLRYELERHKAPLLHLADIYQSLRFVDMDEDRLKEIVHDIGIEDYTSRLMVALQEIMGLTEGFMPFVPKTGRATQHLINTLTKFNTYI